MDLKLKNKVAFIAGSSRGIGQGIAAAFLEEGCKTVITGRDKLALNRAKEIFEEKFGDEKVMAIGVDLSKEADLKKALNDTIEKWGQLDCIVISIGSGKSTSGWVINNEEWNRVLDLNVGTSVRIATAALSFIKKTKIGSIVFIASIAGLETTQAPLAYSAAKAALVNYASNLSRLVAEYGIRVNCVAPGNILFPGGSWESHIQQREKEVNAYIRNEVPQNRFGTVEEIADVVTFLSSERASFVTGACWVVDGGQTRTF